MIVIPARVCPDEILSRTRNAASAIRRAKAAGWTAQASFAVGGEDDAEIQSVFIYLYRPLPHELRHMTARWSGPLGQESLNFDGAWRRVEPKGVKPLTWTEFSWLIEHDEHEARPTTRAAAEALDKDQLELLAAIRVTTEGLGAVPIRVVSQGSTGNWCQGSILRSGDGLPAMKMRCINLTVAGDTLCAGPCSGSI